MSVVNYIIEKASPTSAIVTWPNMLNGDIGQPFDYSDWSSQGAEFSGTLGTSGEYALNEASSVQNPVFRPGSPSMAALPNALGTESLAVIQPEILNGDGTTDITVTLVLTPHP